MKAPIPLHAHLQLQEALVRSAQPPTPPGTLVRLLRERLGMNQRQLARRANLPQSHLALIEQGKVDVQWGSLARILAALRCKPILKIQPDKSPDAMLVERAREVARRRVTRMLGTMALEKQEPDAETRGEMIRREERRLLSRPSPELWDDEAL